MTLLHFSDTHLGYNELDKIGNNGVNLREQDFYDAFTFVIDQAIGLRPDVVIHSGDFFHRPSPPNRPMIFALEQLRRLSEANIPIVIIAGNHETPKTVYTSPILKAFRTIKGVYPIFGQAYEQIQFGDVVIHGVPHINDERILLEEMDKIQPVDDKFNVIMLHTSIGRSYIMEEFGEQLYPKERLALLDQFDYVALGHWHNVQKVDKLKTGWYCGSTERMSDTEANKEKGFYTFELIKGITVEPVFHPVPARPWHRLDLKDCQSQTLEDLLQALEAFASETSHEAAIISIYLHQIDAIKSIALPQRLISSIFEKALHVHTKRIFTNSEHSGSSRFTESGQSTVQLLDEFIRSEAGEQAEDLVQRARGYFERWREGRS